MDGCGSWSEGLGGTPALSMGGEDRDEKLLLALDRATDRVGRAVARALEGHHD